MINQYSYQFLKLKCVVMVSVYISFSDYGYCKSNTNAARELPIEFQGSHQEVVDRYFAKRENWTTSNLGSILFKNVPPNKFHRPLRENKTYVVLIWKTWYWLKERYIENYMGNKNKPDPLASCSVKNCIFTGNNSRVNEADVVVIHSWAPENPDGRNRSNHQKWVFLTDESPMHLYTLRIKDLTYKEIADQYNWTMTYRTFSDVPVPYGRTVAKLKPKLSPSLFKKATLIDVVPYWYVKRMDVLAVFLSSSKLSFRMRFLEELSKHMKVDVFGKIGPHKNNFTICPGFYRQDCELLKTYFFYLSIENARCRQYMTTHLFHNAYSKGAIPVILGPPLEDCEQLLPPKSFIHVDHFGSYEELAKHIRNIPENRHALVGYHRWRNHFEVVNEHGYFRTKSYHYCRLCEALNYNDNEVRTYSEDDAKYFFDSKLNCVNFEAPIFDKPKCVSSRLSACLNISSINSIKSARRINTPTGTTTPPNNNKILFDGNLKSIESSSQMNGNNNSDEGTVTYPQKQNLQNEGNQKSIENGSEITKKNSEGVFTSPEKQSPQNDRNSEIIVDKNNFYGIGTVTTQEKQHLLYDGNTKILNNGSEIKGKNSNGICNVTSLQIQNRLSDENLKNINNSSEVVKVKENSKHNICVRTITFPEKPNLLNDKNRIYIHNTSKVNKKNNNGVGIVTYPEKQNLLYNGTRKMYNYNISKINDKNDNGVDTVTSLDKQNQLNDENHKMINNSSEAKKNNAKVTATSPRKQNLLNDDNRKIIHNSSEINKNNNSGELVVTSLEKQNLLNYGNYKIIYNGGEVEKKNGKRTVTTEKQNIQNIGNRKYTKKDDKIKKNKKNGDGIITSQGKQNLQTDGNRQSNNRKKSDKGNITSPAKKNLKNNVIYKSVAVPERTVKHPRKQNLTYNRNRKSIEYESARRVNIPKSTAASREKPDHKSIKSKSIARPIDILKMQLNETSKNIENAYKVNISDISILTPEHQTLKYNETRKSIAHEIDNASTAISQNKQNLICDGKPKRTENGSKVAVSQANITCSNKQNPPHNERRKSMSSVTASDPVEVSNARSYKQVMLNIKYESIDVKRYYDKRKNWKTSNLGSVLFKNVPPVEFRQPSWENKTYYVVLLWKHRDWKPQNLKQNLSEDPLKHCSVKNCRFTEANTSITEADAVAIHTSAFTLPNVTKKKSDQRWIIVTDEPPYEFSKKYHFMRFSNVKNVQKHLADMFNWSMSYRTDADVPVPSGRTVPLPEPLMSEAEFEQTALEKIIPNWTVKKSGVIAATVSIGFSPYRESFFRELNSFMKIDVLKTCKRSTNKDCETTAQYLFFLAVERSRCRQYLSENLFSLAYSKGAIPVILGPPLEDCQKLLPPNSFIHVDHFNNSKELTAHMKMVAEDTFTLRKYHKWRIDFKVVNEHGYFGTEAVHYCRLCEAMNYNDREVKVFSEDDVRSFFEPSLNCIKSFYRFYKGFEVKDAFI